MEVFQQIMEVMELMTTSKVVDIFVITGIIVLFMWIAFKVIWEFDLMQERIRSLEEELKFYKGE